MNIIIKGASGFMGLFDTGAETFISWVSGIVPKVLLLLILMNTIIALIGQERVNKFAKLCSGNVIPCIWSITIYFSIYVRKPNGIING